MKVSCEECGGEVEVPDDVIEGEIVSCRECGASYEVSKEGESVRLKPAQAVGEDWGE